MTEKEKELEERLQDAVLEFIEARLKEPLPGQELDIVPAMANVLLRLWGY